MPDQLPESNVDNVALNLTYNAIVAEVASPGESLAQLFERMAAMSRDIAGEYRVANADWQALLDSWDSSEVEPVVNRQAQALGDTWAKRWMLCKMVERLYGDLERSCLEHPAASKIARVTYAKDGTLESWSLRRD